MKYVLAARTWLIAGPAYSISISWLAVAAMLLIFGAMTVWLIRPTPLSQCVSDTDRLSGADGLKLSIDEIGLGCMRGLRGLHPR